MDMHLERLLKQHASSTRWPSACWRSTRSHPADRRAGQAACRAARATPVADAAWLLLDQARILEGETLPDPTAFAKRLGEVLGKAFS